VIVTINENIRFRFDAGNWTLERRVVVGSGPEENRRGRKPKEESIGEERWVAVGYYGTLRSGASQLLERHMDLLVSDEVRSIQDMIRVIEKAGEVILKAVKENHA